jgi:tetratricopeptide (TPR) repeat protein
MIAFHYDWDYVRAERLIRQALALQTSPQSHLSLAHLLSNLGRHEEALAEIQRARSLDPAWPIARALEGQFLFMARRYREALDRLDPVVAIDPDFPNGHVMRTYPLLALGRYADALPVYDRVDGLVRGGISDQPFTWAVALRGYALAKLGRQKEAEMILAQLRAAGRKRYVPPHHEALLLHALGRNAEALEQLREAVAARDVFVTFLGVDPKWDDLRGTPAFTTLLSRANLLDVSQAIVR